MPKTNRGGKRAGGGAGGGSITTKPAYDGRYEKYYSLDFVKKYRDGFMTFTLNPQAIREAAENGDIKANSAMTMRINSLNQYYGQDRNREKRQEAGKYQALINDIAKGNFEEAQKRADNFMRELKDKQNIPDNMKELIKPKKKK